MLAAPPDDADEDAPAAAPTSPLQADLMALVDGNDDVLHCDVTLVGNDGVSVEAHRALLHARCPKLFQQQRLQPSTSSSSSSSSSTHSSKRSGLSPSGIASPMLSPHVKAGGNNDEEGTASITVSDATGRALSSVVRFVYSDTLPDFDEMDEQKKKASSRSKSSSNSSSSSSNSSSEALPSGLNAAFELMVAARALSSADAPAMQHLQALCEQHISKRLDLSNVVPLLAKAVDAQYAPLQRVCHEYLAEKKPTTTDPTYAPRLVTALGSNPAALGTAISAAAGSWSCMWLCCAFWLWWGCAYGGCLCCAVGREQGEPPPTSNSRAPVAAATTTGGGIAARYNRKRPPEHRRHGRFRCVHHRAFKSRAFCFCF
jgi:hypothetical protein